MLDSDGSSYSIFDHKNGKINVVSYNGQKGRAAELGKDYNTYKEVIRTDEAKKWK